MDNYFFPVVVWTERCLRGWLKVIRTGTPTSDLYALSVCLMLMEADGGC